MNVMRAWIKRGRMVMIFVENVQFPLGIVLADNKSEGAVVCS